MYTQVHKSLPSLPGDQGLLQIEPVQMGQEDALKYLHECWDVSRGGQWLETVS